jgi:hypothetical protein
MSARKDATNNHSIKPLSPAMQDALKRRAEKKLLARIERSKEGKVGPRPAMWFI